MINANVFAAESNYYETTSVINGVTVNWSYKLNESDQISELVCKNPSDLTGEITLPDTLDGKTVYAIGEKAFYKAPITGIKMGDSVRFISRKAFLDCKELKNVDLGKTEEIEGTAFENCTALEEITIPKTLKKSSDSTLAAMFGGGPVFKGCTNLKNITLEDGIEKVTTYLCAGTSITEINIPNSVKTISRYAFNDCAQLNKITILDNVTQIGEGKNSEDVFKKHNENLTIYCYEGSAAAEYAIKWNIKYVYLTKPVEQKPAEQEPEGQKPTDDKTEEQKPVGQEPADDKTEEQKPTDDKVEEQKPAQQNPTDDKKEEQKPTEQKPANDDTTAKVSLPKTGKSIITVVSIALMSIVAIILHKKYNYYKGV